jgi:DNA polymerase III subunit gamma/tau
MASIYQRARPRRFDEVVGQEHVLDVLAAALRRDVVGHAYLFSGPRGVGKTTTARLLAMAVNCDAAPEERPCGVCESCTLVQAGHHPDVTELDAASNNSVDDVRELREKVALASLRGGRRVWVLDEAHMLSRAAANALLKTLEEPPTGLVFVLATTEPEKLPPTVLSRCQHFRFRRLSEEQIRGKLARLAEAAGVAADEDALSLVARASDGAMRDGESMLERLLVDGGRVTLADAEDALGLPPRERLDALGRAVTEGAWDTLLDEAGALYRDGFAPRTVAEQLGRALRDRLFSAVQAGGHASAPAAEDGDPGGRARAGDDVALLMRAIDALDVISERFVRQNDLYALEIALLRTAAAATGLTKTEPDAEPAPLGVAPAAAVGSVDRATAPVPASGAAPASAAPARAASASAPASPSAAPASDAPPTRATRPPSDAPTAGAGRFSWHPTLTQAPTQLKAFLLPAAAEVADDRLTLRFDDRHAFHHAQLRKREAEVLALVDEHGGAHLTVVLEGPAGRSEHAPRMGDTATGSRSPRDASGGSPAKKA